MGFVDRLGSFGDRPALLFPGGLAVSYAELDRRVHALAAGLGPEKRLVALEAERSEHAILHYLAALKGGHTVALLAPGDAEVIDSFAAGFAPEVQLRRQDGRWRRLVEPAAGSALHPDLALLLGTSGSTGKSRFVRLSTAALDANARSIATFLDLSADDRAALILPLHYSYGLSVLHSHLAVGASVYVAERGVSQQGFAAEIREARCTNLAGVPFSYQQMELAGFRDEPMPHLRFLTVAGGKLDSTLAAAYHRHLERDGKRFFLMYGQTEATARIAYVPPEQFDGHPDCIGVAIPGGSLSLVDEDGRPAEKAGELVYRGPNVMMGYAESRADLARGAEVRELRTGDLAERRPDGFFRIVGRIRRMSKIAGLRIGHEAVEQALAGYGIAAAVTGDDRRLAAAFEGTDSRDLVVRRIAEATGLSPLQIAARRVTALPRLASGKVDYAAVARLADASDATTGRDVLADFRRAFFPRRVSAADSFETLGGDSLVYVQLSLILERRLGFLPEGWDRLTIGEIAELAPPRRRFAALDSAVPLRALAILLVVVHHATLWPLPGGAATLMMLAGLGLARFHGAALMAGDRMRLLRSLVLVLAVYAPLVAGFSLARGEVLWASVFLAGNFGMAEPANMMPYMYWFVEAYAQILLFWLALFSLPPVRRAARARPFGFGLTFLATAVAAKFAVPLVWNIGPARIFTMPDVLYLAVLGWCVHFAETRRQRALLALAAALLWPLLAYTGGNWTGSWVKFALVLGAVLVLLYVPRTTMPRALARLALPVSAASYHIYLLHRILPELLLPEPDAYALQPLTAALAVATGVLTGIVVHKLQAKAVSWLEGCRQSAEQPSPALVALAPVPQQAG